MKNRTVGETVVILDHENKSCSFGSIVSIKHSHSMAICTVDHGDKDGNMIINGHCELNGRLHDIRGEYF